MEGGHTIQQKETRRKTSWETKATRPREGGHTIQQGIKKGDNVRQGETRHREGGRTIQQRETKLGDKLGKQSVRTWTHHPTKGNK